MSSWKFTLCVFYCSSYICSQKKFVEPSQSSEGKNFFLFTQLFCPKKWMKIKKHKQIPKEAMKLNLNHQMSGMPEHLPLYYTVILIYFLCCSDGNGIRRGQKWKPDAKVYGNIKYFTMAAQSICLEHHVYGLENESLFRKRKCSLNFVIVVGHDYVFGVLRFFPFVVDFHIFFTLFLFSFWFVFNQKTLTFRLRCNRWQFFIYLTVVKRFRRQIMTEISFITVILHNVCHQGTAKFIAREGKTRVSGMT